MRWVWADKKNTANRPAHGGLSFETARSAFDDPLALTRHDPHPDGDRWQTVGLVQGPHANGEGYQTSINDAPRDHVAKQASGRRD